MARGNSRKLHPFRHRLQNPSVFVTTQIPKLVEDNVRKSHDRWQPAMECFPSLSSSNFQGQLKKGQRYDSVIDEETRLPSPHAI